MVRLPRPVAVKDGPYLGPPKGLVLDGREHGGRLVCVGIGCCCMMPPLVVDRGEISDRGMAAAWIVEALDEFEDRTTCFGLCLEPTPIEQLALEGREETLAHRVVVRVADRAHRWAHACITTAATELDRGILRTLVGVMDHAAGPPRHQRHVQRIDDQLFRE